MLPGASTVFSCTVDICTACERDESAERGAIVGPGIATGPVCCLYELGRAREKCQVSRTWHFSGRLARLLSLLGP